MHNLIKMNKQQSSGTSGQEKSSQPSPNDQRANVHNPTSSDYKANNDNKSNQGNPNNPAYSSSRGGNGKNK